MILVLTFFSHNYLKEWQKHYFAFLFGISLIAAYLPLSNNISEMPSLGFQFNSTNLTYLIIATLSFGPAFHWIILHGGIGSERVRVSVNDLC